MAEITLRWHDYRYFPYERELARREVLSLLHLPVDPSSPYWIEVEGNCDPATLTRLVYFSGFSVDGRTGKTRQCALEQSDSELVSTRKQSTRYSVHGLHEYKGKFNPQIAQALLNLAALAPGSTVFDPFCGSGTTLVECAHGEMLPVGCDMNPLAVFLSSAKLEALTIDAGELAEDLDRILATNEEGDGFRPASDERRSYLERWFEPPTLKTIEGMRAAIAAEAPQHQAPFLAILSDLLRDYSLQEPQDLRIRKRYSPFPTKPLMIAFAENARRFIRRLEAAQQVIGVKQRAGRAYLADCRSLGAAPDAWRPAPPYDAAITSPPYVTALPYIDTQRLSLVWLGLCQPGELRELEARLTGSREFVSQDRARWASALRENSAALPEAVYEFCQSLGAALGDSDGFRRQAMPHLVYRYLVDMRLALQNTWQVLRSGGLFALVVGHNHAFLGGERFDIDTPDLLRQIAVALGWNHEESIALQTYQRYGLNMNNAVRGETLLLLRKP